jgi:hypothetical protein
MAVSAMLLVALTASGCSRALSPAAPASVASAAARPVSATDYANPAHWLARPSVAEKPVDVFFLGPTEYSRVTSGSPVPGPVVGPVDDARMAARMRVILRHQASAFAPSANVYAPLYRQVDSGARTYMTQQARAALVGGGPADDAIAAFDYYITHYNEGRPFILAGHSQGSNVLANLLSRYMPTHPDVYRRMVAAYLVGYSITPEYLASNPELRFATGASDTGVIVSWNTEAPSIAAANPVVMTGGLAINPISWTRTETTATAEQSLGSDASVLASGRVASSVTGGPVRVTDVADARVDVARGVIVCSTIDPDRHRSGFPDGVYHSLDYALYYYDIRANAAARVAAYLKSNPR